MLFGPLTLLHSAGDSVHRGGLPAPCAHGLPRGAAPAHAALLAEGEKPSAQVHRRRHLPGQADPQPQQSAAPGGGHPEVREVRHATGSHAVLFNTPFKSKLRT